MKTADILKKRKELVDKIENLLKQLRTALGYDEIMSVSGDLHRLTQELDDLDNTDWIVNPQDGE